MTPSPAGNRSRRFEESRQAVAAVHFYRPPMPVHDRHRTFSEMSCFASYRFELTSGCANGRISILGRTIPLRKLNHTFSIRGVRLCILTSAPSTSHLLDRLYTPLGGNVARFLFFTSCLSSPAAYGGRLRKSYAWLQRESFFCFFLLCVSSWLFH